MNRKRGNGPSGCASVGEGSRSFRGKHRSQTLSVALRNSLAISSAAKPFHTAPFSLQAPALSRVTISRSRREIRFVLRSAESVCSKILSSQYSTRLRLFSRSYSVPLLKSVFDSFREHDRIPFHGDLRFTGYRQCRHELPVGESKRSEIMPAK